MRSGMCSPRTATATGSASRCSHPAATDARTCAWRRSVTFQIAKYLRNRALLEGARERPMLDVPMLSVPHETGMGHVVGGKDGAVERHRPRRCRAIVGEHASHADLAPRRPQRDFFGHEMNV